MKENDFIEDQLAHAGEADNLPPEVLKMDRCRVTSQSDIAEEEFLFRLSGTPCFPRCELTTVTGPAKSGKTFLTSMIMACCARRQVLEWERVSEAPLRVCWIDTEQSCNEQGLPYTTKKPDIRQRGEDGKFTSRNDSLCQAAGSKADSFCQTYILRSGGDNWQWDLRRLFADGLGTAVTLSLDDLKRSVMSKANIRSARYYEKLFEEACAQRIVKTMLDRGGRVLAAMP